MDERTKQHKHMKMKMKKNKNSFLSLKRRSNNVVFDEVELNVAQILIQLHHLIAESESRWLHRFPFSINWSVKRKRSALNSLTLSSQSSPLPPPPPPPPPIQPLTTTADATEFKPITASASTSPTTPLSLFSLSESNDRLVKISSQSIQQQQQGKKKEELLEMVKELTQCRLLLKQEVETERYRHMKLKEINSELKLKKNELIREVKINPHIERNDIMNLIIPKFKPTDTANQNHTQFKQQQQQQQQQHFHLYNNKDRDFGIVKRRDTMTTTTTTGINIPDLNVSVHDGMSSIEFLRLQQHFDFRANIINKSLAAAEARKRRRQIYKGKNKT